MKLRTIASGSKGNCYLLETNEGGLLLEAGIPIKKIKQALKFNFRDIMGCLITHEHGDHAKAVKDIAKAGIDVYSSKGTLDALDCSGHRFVWMKQGRPFMVGNFEVMGFGVEHDAADPFGYLIRYQNSKMLFATDTYYLKYQFPNLTHIAIECNYVKSTMMALVDKGALNLEHAKRVMKSHMSLENLIDFLKANDLSKVQEIHLLHLSDGSSDINIIQEEIRKIYQGKLIIAGGD